LRERERERGEEVRDTTFGRQEIIFPLLKVLKK
jgi:hypothetical protein